MISGGVRDWRLLLRLVGGGLGLTGVLFVGFRLYEHSDEIDLARFELTDWILVFGLSVAYCVANLVLARAWWCQLRFLGVKPSWIWAAKAYGVSQLAKYLPGNVFHIAGRQALGMAAGLPARPLLKSAVLELGLIALIGATFGVLALPLLGEAFSPWESLLAFMSCLAATYVGSVRWLGRSFGAAVLWHAFFLALSGLIFLGTLILVVGHDVRPSLIPALCGVYVLAWLAGLVTPGAPAGVGVREAVIMLALAKIFEPSDLLVAIVLGRIVTISGDMLFFFGCSLLSCRVPSQV